jgi:hypothetical protein
MKRETKNTIMLAFVWILVIQISVLFLMKVEK